MRDLYLGGPVTPEAAYPRSYMFPLSEEQIKEVRKKDIMYLASSPRFILDIAKEDPSPVFKPPKGLKAEIHKYVVKRTPPDMDYRIATEARAEIAERAPFMQYPVLYTLMPDESAWIAGPKIYGWNLELQRVKAFLRLWQIEWHKYFLVEEFPDGARVRRLA